MKDYEIVYIFNPNVDEDNVSQKVESLQSLLLADGGESLACLLYTSDAADE